MDTITLSESLPEPSFVKVRGLPHGIPDVNEGTPLFERCCSVKETNLVPGEFPLANLWRSWAVYSDSDCEVFFGIFPWVIDIDIEQSNPDLRNARKLALDFIEILNNRSAWEKSVRDLVVVFSGRKGLHLQLPPIAGISLQDFRTYLINEGSRKDIPRNGNIFYGNAVVDTINYEKKPWLRLIGTKYSWREGDSEIRSRRILPFSAEEFRILSLEKIIAKSEGE
jgi:hypothetical protein